MIGGHRMRHGMRHGGHGRRTTVSVVRGKGGPSVVVQRRRSRTGALLRGMVLLSAVVLGVVAVALLALVRRRAVGRALDYVARAYVAETARDPEERKAA